jgi:acetyl-CoA synthetase
MPKTIKIRLHFVLFEKTEPGLYLFRFETQSAKFANVLKLKIKGTCFLANGEIPELYVTALGTLKYTAVFVLYFLYLALNLFIKE